MHHITSYKHLSPFSSTYHIDDADVTVGEDDGVGWRCHWQHESEGAGDGARDHVVQRVHPSVHRLQQSITGTCLSPSLTGQMSSNKYGKVECESQDGGRPFEILYFSSTSVVQT